MWRLVATTRTIWGCERRERALLVPYKEKPLFSMAQWLDPWILNAKGAKGAKDPKGGGGSHQKDFGLRNSATSPSGALLRKNLCFRWRSGSIPGLRMLKVLRAHSLDEGC